MAPESSGPHGKTPQEPSGRFHIPHKCPVCPAGPFGPFRKGRLSVTTSETGQPPGSKGTFSTGAPHQFPSKVGPHPFTFVSGSPRGPKNRLVSLATYPRKPSAPLLPTPNLRASPGPP
ncbi:uncharacterized protein LOC119573523 [Penaeus monodon]|uniref:uncharacterized protein LOC119573523 n=1 Tax=Penaeus monodon TaxID=6687 RepID=UPI0018A6F0E0|nr:uncharacterized protein LOC119573523 [Penaeus monodon]